MALTLETYEAVKFGTSDDALTAVPEIDAELRLRLGSISTEKLQEYDTKALGVLASAFGDKAGEVLEVLKKMPQFQLVRLHNYLTNGSIAVDGVDAAYREARDKIVAKATASLDEDTANSKETE